MKIYLCLGIIYRLMQGKRVKALELSNEFEVSTRTIYRNLDIIETAGFSLVSFMGKNGGYELLNGKSLDKGFSDYDIATLIKGINLLPKTPQIIALKEKISTLI